MTPQEADQAGALLSKLEPGFLPKPVFDQVARVTATPIVEIVPVRRTADRVEVLLLRRPADDPVWPDGLHAPGTVVRGSDTSLQDAFDRILRDELGAVSHDEPEFVTTVMHHSGRGMEVAQVYVMELTGQPADGSWHDADALPDDFVRSQLDFVPTAVAHYKNKV